MSQEFSTQEIMEMLDNKTFPSSQAGERIEFVTYQIEGDTNEYEFGVLYDDYPDIIFEPTEISLCILLIEYQQWELMLERTASLIESYLMEIL